MNKLGKIRSDSKGDGRYGSKRGGRLHKGIDWERKVGAPFQCPWSKAKLLRKIYPYADDSNFEGGVYEIRDSGERYFAIIFYMRLKTGTKEFIKGDTLGYVQDISKRYGPSCIPHVHIELYTTFNYESMAKGD